MARMILTCPACATRYFVGADAVPASGRVVRCAACGENWRAMPDAEPGGDAQATASAAFAPSSAPREIDVSPGSLSPDLSAPELPQAFRAQVEARRRTREAIATGVTLAAVGTAFVVVMLSAVLFRTEVVRFWPRTAGAYAAVKLPVNPTGLMLDTVQGGPALQAGRAVMVVTGAERNVEARAREAYALRVSLFDKAGKRTASQVVRPEEGEIAPGEARTFRAVFVDPPLDSAEFGVDFAFDVPRAPKPRGRAKTPDVRYAQSTPHRPASPAAVVAPEAVPLPAGSAYALPAAPPHG